MLGPSKLVADVLFSFFAVKSCRSLPELVLSTCAFQQDFCVQAMRLSERILLPTYSARGK